MRETERKNEKSVKMRIRPVGGKAVNYSDDEHDEDRTLLSPGSASTFFPHAKSVSSVMQHFGLRNLHEGLLDEKQVIEHRLKYGKNGNCIENFFFRNFVNILVY
jgi:hypothetical protein